MLLYYARCKTITV